MRRKKKKASSQPSYPPSQMGGESMHIRLCHVCLHLSESDHPIVQCQECQRYLTIEPLVEEHLASHEEDGEEHEGHGELMGGLNGLSVVW